MTWMVALAIYFLPSVLLLAVALRNRVPAAADPKPVQVMPHRWGGHQGLRRRQFRRR
jgi:hypothetical protein